MQQLIPQPPLSAFVDLFWFYDRYAPPHAKEAALPTGTIELVVELGDDCRDAGIVGGPHSKYFVLDTSRPMSVIGVHFKPGGAFPFLPAPADELHNQSVPLELLWGHAAHELRDRLHAAPTAGEKLRVLEGILLCQLLRPPVQHPAVAWALKEFDRVPQLQKMAAVAQDVGLSCRRFIQLFREQVGLAPKVYCRVRRFQEVIRRVHSGHAPDWAKLALDCGYFDQAHLIHEFDAFCGMSPTKYLQCRGQHLNHLPLPE